MIAPNTTLPSASLAFVVLVRIALPPFSVVGDSAVGMNGLASDKPAVVGDQEQGSGGDLLRHPLAPEGDPGGARHPPLVPFGIGARGIDTARADHVDPDVVGGELRG